MAKKTEQTEEKIPRWELKVDYVESCNCNFGCPCNFSGYPTDGFCEALVGYHIRQGRFGRTRLDGLDVIYAAAWPKAIHQGGGTLRLYVSEAASAEQRDALVRIFSGKAKGSGAFELFGSTMADIQPPVFTAIEFTPAGRQSSFRVPGALEVQLARFTNPVSGEVQDVRVNLPKGFIFRSAQAARTLVMTILGTGPLSCDHAGRNAFYARLAAAARRAGVPVVLTTAVRRADGRGSNRNARLFMATRRSPRPLVPGTPQAEIVPEIGIAESDLVLPRMHGLSPMSGTELDPVLRNLGVRTIVAVGVSVNVAITNLVFDAVNAGYQVVVPRDAVAGLPASYVEAVFEHTLGLLATVTTAAEVLRVWDAAG